MTSSRYLQGAAILLAASCNVCSGFVAPIPRALSSAKASVIPTNVVPESSFVDVISSISTVISDAAVPEEGGISYSKASYYTILGLYVLSFPGLWSTIKRSTKAKFKRKTYVT